MGKLNHYVRATTVITLQTGMHIGGPTDAVKIGGIDNPVIRNPITQLPYIPGSSLKGRFRMALELKYGDFDKSNRGVGPSQDPNHESMVVKLFGSGSAKTNNEPSRFLFRDSELTEDSQDFAKGEEKIEVKIDREKMAAFQGGNRTQERIPAGAKFNMEVMIPIFENDEEPKFKLRLEEARKIVELEFLGGSGSRGYGQVKIEEFHFEQIDI
ncbi:MAG: type III-A CRISPR-associated RAMP protein Csm3 [Melioribacteraceae bacterium]|nr:type III-A CRISPR-associated RAMP protein Csm3 [Melioribacteraceae bacterium]